MTFRSFVSKLRTPYAAGTLAAGGLIAVAMFFARPQPVPETQADMVLEDDDLMGEPIGDVPALPTGLPRAGQA